MTNKNNNKSPRNDDRQTRTLDSLDTAVLEAVVGGARAAAPAVPVSAPATCGDYIITVA